MAVYDTRLDDMSVRMKQVTKVHVGHYGGRLSTYRLRRSIAVVDVDVDCVVDVCQRSVRGRVVIVVVVRGRIFGVVCGRSAPVGRW